MCSEFVTNIHFKCRVKQIRKEEPNGRYCSESQFDSSSVSLKARYVCYLFFFAVEVFVINIAINIYIEIIYYSSVRQTQDASCRR